MSAQKRTNVRGKRTTAPKTAKKVVKKVSKKVTKKTTKKAVKKVVKKTGKKVTKKVAKKVSRARKKPPAILQTVREARYGGHKNTIPTNPKAPGSILGRSFTLSMAGLSVVPFNTDTVAIAIARMGGVAIMCIGLALSWNIFNTIARLPEVPTVATVIESQLPAVQVAIAQDMPLTGEVPIIITAPKAEAAVLLLQNASTTYVVGAAEQRTEETWEVTLDTEVVANGSYMAIVLAEYVDEYQKTITHEEVIIENTAPVFVITEVLEPAELATDATSSEATTTETEVVSTSTPTQPSPIDEELPVITSMPVLETPNVRMVVPDGEQLIIVGTAGVHQSVELLLLKEQFAEELVTQANGWWYFVIDAPERSDVYELYARASTKELSAPLDFTVVDGRLHKQTPAGTTQTTNVQQGSVVRESLLWYLIASITIIGLGAVLLLVGHHLHHTRRRVFTSELQPLDQPA